MTSAIQFVLTEQSPLLRLVCLRNAYYEDVIIKILSYYIIQPHLKLIIVLQTEMHSFILTAVSLPQ